MDANAARRVVGMALFRTTLRYACTPQNSKQCSVVLDRVVAVGALGCFSLLHNGAGRWLVS